MNQIAVLLENTTIYWYSIFLALAVGTGLCFFMAFSARAGIPGYRAAVCALTALCLSLLLSRLVFWYCRADTYHSLRQALTDRSTGTLAPAGAFFGCGLTALLLGKYAGGTLRLLDCMCGAGSAAICIGRLGGFFSSADRGQILTEMTFLPWSYPVMNAASGQPEPRLATFLFQAILAGVLFAVLWYLSFSTRPRHIPAGKPTLLFLMVYGASQVLLDSTRYDSLYLRSNGFVSMVQILAAVALAVSIILCSVGTVKRNGFRKWMLTVWVSIVGLFGLAGYMEYYVQRHGRQAFFAYTVMEHCLVIIIVLGIRLWKRSFAPQKET